MKNIIAFIRKSEIIPLAFAYLVALAVYFQFEKAGFPLPMWCFHLYGIITVVFGTTGNLLGDQLVIGSKNQLIFTAHHIASKISHFMITIWAAVIFPAEVSYIISPIFVRRNSEGYLKFLLILTAILGVICFSLYFFGISKILKQKKISDEMLKIMKSPELCCEESFEHMEMLQKKFTHPAMQEWSKIILCGLYEHSGRQDLALETYLSVKPEKIGTIWPMSFYRCDLIYHYLAAGRTNEATAVLNQYSDEMETLYREARPPQLHTFALYFRKTGDIPAARRVLNELSQKKIEEPTTEFCYYIENGFVSLMENNLSGAREAYEKAYPLARFPNQKKELSELEEAISAY